MMVVTPGIALSRRPLKEHDRLALLYTRDFGKLRVRFGGVEKPRAKLKAFTEPMVRAEYRLFLKPGAEIAKAAGGTVLASHPRLRTDLRKTAAGLYFCELMLRITPERQPNLEKYRLLSESLARLDGEGETPWLALAYTLRLLGLAGFGLAELSPSGAGGTYWRALHETPIPELAFLPWDPALHRDWWMLTASHVDRSLDQPVHSREFLSLGISMGAPSA